MKGQQVEGGHITEGPVESGADLSAFEIFEDKRQRTDSVKSVSGGILSQGEEEIQKIDMDLKIVKSVASDKESVPSSPRPLDSSAKKGPEILSMSSKAISS